MPSNRIVSMPTSRNARWRGLRSRPRPDRRAAVGRVDRDRAAGDAGHAGAELFVGSLLLFAEEHVAVVDNSVDFQDVEGAQAALAPPAVEDHPYAVLLQRVQHGLVLGDFDRHAEPGNLHRKWLGGETAAVAEGLEPQPVDRPAAAPPGPAGRLEHPD